MKYEDWFCIICAFAKSNVFPVRKKFILAKLDELSKINPELRKALDDAKNGILMKDYAHLFK